MLQKILHTALHNAVSDFFHKFPEVTGFMVFLSTLILSIPTLEIINGVLQALVLFFSMLVSIFTIIYLRKKTRKLK